MAGFRSDPKGERRKKVLERIRIARVLQNGRWWEDIDEDIQWLALLMKAVGKLAKGILDGADSRRRLVSVAAVAVAWLENLEAKGVEIPRGRPAGILNNVRIETPSPSAEQGDDYPSPSLKEVIRAAKYWAEQIFGQMALRTFRLEEIKLDEEKPLWSVLFSIIPPAQTMSEVCPESDSQRLYKQVYVGIFVGPDESESALADLVKGKFFEEHKGI
ncbi:MAG: hypothetical protein OT477_16010 [Chloroflexi bacterium]|nr:hypothetical protein [Chloroflexota bacterium]